MPGGSRTFFAQNGELLHALLAHTPMTHDFIYRGKSDQDVDDFGSHHVHAPEERADIGAEDCPCSPVQATDDEKQKRYFM